MAGRRGDTLGRIAMLGLGLASGAAGMWLLETRRGAARRAWLRDQVLSKARHSLITLRKDALDVRNRLRGRLYELRRRNERVDDDLLVERVRAQLGRPVSHSGLVEVHAIQGRVVLEGAVLASELQELVNRVSHIRGVGSVESRLQLFETPLELERKVGHFGLPRPQRAPPEPSLHK